jgi:hypothetical protein
MPACARISPWTPASLPKKKSSSPRKSLFLPGVKKKKKGEPTVSFVKSSSSFLLAHINDFLLPVRILSRFFAPPRTSFSSFGSGSSGSNSSSRASSKQ